MESAAQCQRTVGSTARMTVAWWGRPPTHRLRVHADSPRTDRNRSHESEPTAVSRENDMRLGPVQVSSAQPRAPKTRVCAPR